MLARMQARQPTIVFVFTVILGLLRLFAYAASPIGLELSVTALLHYVALHILTFTFAAFPVASLSRATATRAAFVALYAQAVLFLGAFVDVGLGLALTDYGQTYTGLFGGSPGSLLAMLAYGAVIAWGVYDATIGRRGPRATRAPSPRGWLFLPPPPPPFPPPWRPGVRPPARPGRSGSRSTRAARSRLRSS